MLTGAPGARDQHFIGHAYVVLERERQDSVRLAVLAALEQSRSAGEAVAPADVALIDSVRDIAGYIAQRLMNERMGVLSDLARAGRLQSAQAAFDEAVSCSPRPASRSRRQRFLSLRAGCAARTSRAISPPR